MRRRLFVALSAGAAAALPLVSAGRSAYQQSASKARGQRGRRARGVLVCVRPIDWHPTSWRDVPPAPFDVASIDATRRSLSEARKLAKRFNQEQMRLGVCSWLVVVATDGRLASGKGGRQ